MGCLGRLLATYGAFFRGPVQLNVPLTTQVIGLVVCMSFLRDEKNIKYKGKASAATKPVPMACAGSSAACERNLFARTHSWGSPNAVVCQNPSWWLPAIPLAC